MPVLGVGTAGYGSPIPIAGPMIVIGTAAATPGIVQVAWETSSVNVGWEVPSLQVGFEI